MYKIIDVAVYNSLHVIYVECEYEGVTWSTECKVSHNVDTDEKTFEVTSLMPTMPNPHRAGVFKFIENYLKSSLNLDGAQCFTEGHHR